MVKISAKKTNAQFAIEFVVLIAFMFLVFLGFIAVITSKLIESKEAEVQETAEDIAKLVSNEIYTAKPLSDGYSRTFELPNKINGNDYTIEIIGDRELVVEYPAGSGDEYVSFLPEKVEGDVNDIDQLNKIIKIEGWVYLNAFECSDAINNADGDNHCDFDGVGESSCSGDPDPECSGPLDDDESS